MLRPVYKIKNLETLNDIYHSLTKKFLTGLNYLIYKKLLYNTKIFADHKILFQI